MAAKTTCSLETAKRSRSQNSIFSQDKSKDASLKSTTNSALLNDSFTLPGMRYNKLKQRKSRLPRPLRLPKTYQPHLLSPLQEQMLAQRLSKVPERWNEKYVEEAEQRRMFVAKRVTPTEAERIVRQLSATPKQEEPKKDIEEHDNLFGFEQEHEPNSNEERKFDENEVDRLVQRLTQARIRNRKESNEDISQPTMHGKVYITKNEMSQLTERLSRPKSHVDPEDEQLKRDNCSRYKGKKMGKKELENFVQRISRNDAKIDVKEERGRKQQLGYFAVWTPCDADFAKWRLVNRE
eukprot:gene6192-11596_t